MGRNAAKELQRIVGAIGSYLSRAEADGSLGLSYDAIEAATGVSRGHLSRRKETEITALVERIAAIKHERGSRLLSGDGDVQPSHDAPPTADGNVGIAGASMVAVVPIETLSKMIGRHLADFARLQQQWLSRHVTGQVSDAPLALHDADVLLLQLRRSADQMRPLVTEWNRRAARLAQEAPPAAERVERGLDLVGHAPGPIPDAQTPRNGPRHAQHR